VSYRDDLVAIEAHVESLRREAQAKLDELERAQALANEARSLVRKRVIEAEVATPCTMRWDDMAGDDARVRHCGRCNKNVYNFSELTRDEIDAVIAKYERKPCARFFVRADGTMLTKDCTYDIRVRPPMFVAALGAAVIAAGAALGMGGAVVDAHRGEAAGWPWLPEAEEAIAISGGMDFSPPEGEFQDDMQVGDRVYGAEPEADERDNKPFVPDFTPYMPEGSR
jgi:hypothetical protein